MNMAELTGLETIVIIKERTPVLPCILVTADASDDLRQEALDANAWSVLWKPVRLRELMTSVSTALSSVYDDETVTKLLA